MCRPFLITCCVLRRCEKPGSITTIMKSLKCKTSAQFAYNYSISVLSKCSKIISHRSSIFEGRYIDHRSSKVDTSIFKSQHIDLRRSTHQSLIIDLRRSTHRSSVFEGRHIHLRKSSHQSSKVDIHLRRSKAETSHRQFVTEYCPQRCSIVLYLKISYGIISDEVTHAHTYVYTATATLHVTPHVH